MRYSRSISRRRANRPRKAVSDSGGRQAWFGLGCFLVGRWLLWVLAVVLPPTAGAATQVVPVIVVPALMMDFEDRIEALWHAARQ